MATENFEERAEREAHDAKESADNKKASEDIGDDLMGQQGINRRNPSQK